MNYKWKRNMHIKEYQNFGIYKPIDYFKPQKFTFEENEWISKTNFFLSQFSENNYDIYPLYQYISACNTTIPYEMLLESQLLNTLLNYFNQLVSNMIGNMELNQVLLIPEKNIKTVDSYLLIFLRIFTILLQTNFLIENEFFNSDFFFSLSKLCVFRTAYCYIEQESNTRYSLCIESLKFAKLLFEISPPILFEFEENLIFSRILYTQYIMAQVFEIKYYSLNALLPWMSHYPANIHIFDIFRQEMTKTIDGKNLHISKVKTANNHYKDKKLNEKHSDENNNNNKRSENDDDDDLYDHFFKGTENYIKKSDEDENDKEQKNEENQQQQQQQQQDDDDNEDESKKIENEVDEDENNFGFVEICFEDENANDTEFSSLDNKFDIISLFLNGFLLFIQFRLERKTSEEEEEKIEDEDDLSPYVTMDYAFDNGILYFAKFAILSNHEQTILNGFKIFNLYLVEYRVKEEIVIAFLEEIKEKIPCLLYFSKKVCHEETNMLLILLEYLTYEKFENFFDQQFMHYLLHVLDDKNYQWKRYMIDFIGRLMIDMNFDFIEFLLNEVDIIEIFSDICELADDKITNSILDGIFRIIQNESLKSLLIEKGLKDELFEYIKNPNYSEKTQVILQLIQPDDENEE